MNFTSRSFPSRIADLGFSALVPNDWIMPDLPEETPDFQNPPVCFPLALLMAPYAAVVTVVVARPAYDDGSLQDWAAFLLNHNGLEPRAIGTLEIAGVPGLAGEAVQESEMGPMLVRFAFLEDGGRLINFSLSAPEALEGSVREAWFALLASFTLETPMGSRFTLEDHAVPPGPAGEEPSMPEAVEPSTASLEVPGFARFALADTASTLNPEHPLNVGMRDRGAGLVPRVLATDDGEKRATLGAGAIAALCDVPYGWHVIDDGRRTLVLDPGGEVQVSLHLIPREGRSTGEVLDAIEAQMRQDYPHPEFTRLSQGRIHALGARGIQDGEVALEQYHMLFPWREDGRVLRARVTSVPERSVDACNLAELILESCSFEAPASPEPAPPLPEDGPAWYRKATVLERENRLEEAERVIHEGCRDIGSAQATAELYLQRMMRLQRAGDRTGALEAYLKSRDFIHHYASCATSGGEGLALSAERDAFLQRLAAAYAGEPEA